MEREFNRRGETRDLFTLKNNIMTLSKQAQNSLELYRGGSPSTIKQLLNMQNTSVVNELKGYFCVTSIDDLAVRLSMGA